MHGWALVRLFGVPCLASAIWFTMIAYQGYCLVYLVGAVQCGPSIYLYSVFGILFFLATLWLAYLWK